MTWSESMTPTAPGETSPSRRSRSTRATRTSSRRELRTSGARVSCGLACGGDRWNGFYLSTDAGLTWSNELVPGYCTDPTMGAGSEQEVSDMFGLSTNTDPVMVFDTFGNLFYSHIAFNNDAKRTTPPSASGSLLVSTYRVSDAGAAVYAKTEAVPSGSGRSADKFLVGPGFSNFDDKQWMTADNSESSPFYGRIYVTWTKFGAQGGQSSINLSHCGGDDAGEPCDGSSWSRAAHGQPARAGRARAGVLPCHGARTARCTWPSSSSREASARPARIAASGWRSPPTGARPSRKARSPRSGRSRPRSHRRAPPRTTGSTHSAPAPSRRSA